MSAPSESSTLPLPPEAIARIDRTFAQALSRREFSGASLLVSRRALVFAKTWGRTGRDGTPITPSTRFDLASLTKPLVTAPLCMSAIARGLLDPDDALSRFFPPGSVPAEKRRITVRHLLSHASGLPAYRPFYLELIGHSPETRRDVLLDMIMRTPLEAAPGEAAVYSDLGFILLGCILERLLGGSLDKLARELVFGPLGIDELHYCPIGTGSDPEVPPAVNPAHSYAATQLCPWRKRLLAGEVDDENAWCLEGVGAHAGLFGTAKGVFSLLSFLSEIHEGAAQDPLWPGELVRSFWKRAGLPAPSTWALGFDTPSPVNSSAGRYFPPNSIGHLGFTGTSFWLDLDRRILVILLTNRIHPTRRNEAIRRFRPLVHDIIMEALTR